jgi:hypothetical protein
MRDDMHKVIVERPRVLDRYSKPRRGRATPLDLFPSKRGMSRDYVEQRGEKSLSDNLAPLRRYLAKQVGRPWNNVFSEIAKKFGTRGPLHHHLRRHIFDFVAVKPRRRGHTWRDDTGKRQSTLNLWNQPFYVDERDGILKRTDRLREEKARRRKLREAKRIARHPPR